MTALAVPGAAGSAQADGTVTVTGTIRDGSAQAWPLWAKVTVDGLPEATAYSSPATGAYSLTVPADGTYTLEVTPRYDGYDTLTRDVEVGPSDTAVDLEIPVDEASCVAPGYHHTTDGLLESFDGTGTPGGWTVVEHIGNGQDWRFNDPGERGNLTGGRGGFAIVDSDLWGFDWEYEGRQDTELISPVVDLSDVAEPAIGFNSDFTMWNYSSPSGIGDVDLSIDGGATWQNIWHVEASSPGPRQVTVPVPQAAGEPDVRVRFHYHEADITAGRWWQVDSVFIGNRRCEPLDGGLVIGQVRDANTDQPVSGATVETGPASTTSIATPGDPALGDGFYWLFAPGTGQRAFTVSRLQYHDLARDVAVASTGATTADFALPAGRVTLDRASLESDTRLGHPATSSLAVTNTGTAPVTVELAERPGKFQIHPVRGEPWSELGEPAREGWRSLADYPYSVRDNVAAAYDGKIYSFGGVPGHSFGAPTADSFVYDPATDTWSRVADMPRPRQEGEGAFIDGRFYYVDGTTGNFGDDFTTALDIYDAATDSWSSGADIPVPMAGAGTAVLDGRLYIVGGCDTRFRCGSTGVFRYDPAANRWESVADYPEPMALLACGAIEERIYCTGGAISYDGGETATYAYDPAADTWTPRADLPIELWNMASTVADGKLLVSGGTTTGEDTNPSTAQGFAYDPVTDSWSALPDSINALTRGGFACGFYKIGGAQSWSNGSPFVEVLPGYDDCGSDRDSPWLSTDGATTLLPGESASIRLGLDAGTVEQPGTYDATLLVRQDSPYGTEEVDVSMHVRPPRSWGKLMGTVHGVRCDGTTQPIAGATVSIAAGDDRSTLRTDDRGRYARWLDTRDNPIQVIASQDGWSTGTAKSRLRPGRASVEDFTLHRTDCG